MATNQHRRYGMLLSVIVSLGLLFIAALPWMIALAYGPLIPPDLPATPTSYALVLGARKTATAVAEMTKPSRFSILGTSSKSQEIYRCPGEANKTGRQIPQGIAIQVFGWYQDNNGTIWFLINDDRFTQQEWIRSDSNLRLSPPDYRNYFSGPTLCQSP